MDGPLVSRLSIVAGAYTIDEAEADDKVWGGYYTEDVHLGTVVHGDHMSPYGHPLIENTSYQYSSLLDACYSDEKPLWWLVLRWLKMILLKTARSYHAKPLMLVAGPLCIGILIGFFVGKQHSRSLTVRSKKIQQSSNKKHQQREQKQVMHLLRIGRLVEFLSAFWYSMRLIVIFYTPQEIPLETLVSGSEKSKYSVTKIVDSKTISQPNRKNQNDNGTPVNENDKTGLSTREEQVRSHLKSDDGTFRECEVSVDLVPQHVAVIMDGNRRYGKAKYGSATKGHWDGSSKLVEFAKWCIAEKVAVLTVYAFSSENWKRDPSEIAALMQIFTKYCDELRIEAIQRNIKIMVLSTDYEKVSSVGR